MIRLTAAACGRIAESATTPCFVIFPQVLEANFRILKGQRAQSGALSFAYPIKTMPIAYLLRYWRKIGKYVEASSASEFSLALACGFSPRRIIVSGPAKAAWLSRVRAPGLTVIVDSAAEAKAIARNARRQGWSVGLRFAPETQVDPDNTDCPDQFGIDRRNWPIAVAALRAQDVDVSILQFHIGGWAGGSLVRLEALRELASLAKAAELTPTRIDIGGGFRQAYREVDGEPTSRIASREITQITRETYRHFPNASEVIVECGRALLGTAGALVLSVLDVKDKYGRTFVICDGGRVNHALPSDWERHGLYFPSVAHSGLEVEATICGPTCMAWDFLARGPVPSETSAGAFVVYEAAGAYHWPWQSAFSHPHASVAIVTQTRAGQLRVRTLLERESTRHWLMTRGA